MARVGKGLKAEENGVKGTFHLPHAPGPVLFSWMSDFQFQKRDGKGVPSFTKRSITKKGKKKLLHLLSLYLDPN